MAPPISRVLISRHLIFCSWRHQCAVTRFENVRQFNIRRGKKQVFKLSHRQPAKRRQIKDYASSWRHCIASKHERWSNCSKSAKFFKKLSFINKRLRYCLKLSAHLLREVLAIKDYAAKTDGCFEMVGNHIQLKKLILFFTSTMSNEVTGKRWCDFFCMYDHSHKKRKDSLETRTEPAVFSL